ncbi:MAG: L,D-transpeptidase [Thermomicrobiales bacterium]
MANAEEWSAPRTIYLPATGHTVDGLFLDMWRSYPALLGAPITEEFEQKTTIGDDPKHIVQYYENVALAYLPELDGDWRVQSLHLGRQALERDLKGNDAKLKAAESARGECGSLSTEECVRFEETGHTLRLGFKTYWDGHGGLQLLGLPITEEFVAKDGYTTQYLERAVLRWKEGESVTPRPLGKEITDQQKIATDPISQPLNVPIYDEALFIPPAPEPAIGGVGPGPRQRGAKEIVVSISSQAIWAYENGEAVMFSYVSTGRPGFDTPLGHYSVLVKYEAEDMAGVLGGEYYNVPDVPYVLYFTNAGHAIHGTYWHSNFGAVMSHGCVNLPMDVASFIYSWAPIGTPVSIVG